MRQVMRRTLGVGGASAVALGAVFFMSGVADAHTPTVTPGCAKDGHATVTIDLKNYNGGGTNTVTATEGSTVVLAKASFKSTYHDVVTLDGTVAHHVVFDIYAFDDPNGANHWTTKLPADTSVCPQPTPPSSSSTAPPSSSAPSSVSTVTSPPSSSSAAVVPPVTTTAPAAPQTAALANTGVNAGVPLAIAGGLVVIGGGLLVGMRLSTRRRKSAN
jgi:hypothetical protein